MTAGWTFVGRRFPLVLALGGSLAGCGGFVDPTDPDFTPGIVVLPGDGNEITPLPPCSEVSFSGLDFETLGVLSEIEDRRDNGPDGKTGTTNGPDGLQGTEDDEDFTVDDILYKVVLRSYDYAITWSGSNGTDIVVRSAEAYEEPLDSSAYSTFAGAEENCEAGPPLGGRPAFFCGDVEDALVPQPLGARCSAAYTRVNATDYLPKPCVERGVGWNVTETRLEGLRPFARRPIIAEHPYDITVGGWCADGDGKSKFVSITERLITPAYPVDD